MDAAKGWKRETETAFKAGKMTRSDDVKVKAAAEEWLELAGSGVALARGGHPYSPSTLRGYRQAMAAHVYPGAVDGGIGDVRLAALSQGQLNAFIERLQAKGLAAQTVKNVVVPLRAIYRRQLKLEKLTVNPTLGASVPAGSGRRLVFLSPEEIPPVLNALAVEDRTLWATAIYTGLRRGELMGLRWSDVDLGAGIVQPHQSYDQPSRTMKTIKSAAGQDRRIPIVAALRDELVTHRLRAGGRGTGLVFARGRLSGVCRAACRTLPFADQAVSVRAKRAWTTAGVVPVTLHNCRHTFASLMIAAMAAANTFDPKTLQHMLGHASIQQTYDRYGHLFPGAEQKAGRMLDEFLAADQHAVELELAAGRVTAALDAIEPDAAWSIVTDLQACLASWQADHRPLPSATLDEHHASECAVRVQRTPRGRAR